MCGIAGIWTKTPIPGTEMAQKCLAMSQMIAHRGPDDEGIVLINVAGESEHYAGNNSIENLQLAHVNEAKGNYFFGLVHRRLSIISPGMAGHQPMQHGNNILAYNGEIFNYKQLDAIHALVNKSNTDTETLSHLLDKYGNTSVSLLDGFFGYACFNVLSGELNLTVDPTSVKHLFYGKNNAAFCFASESKVIRKTLGLNTINNKAIFHFLTEEMAMVPNAEGNAEMYISGVEKIRPGTLVTVKNNFEIASNTYALAATENDRSLEELLVHGVEQRLMADVPLGFAASGGLDSAIIAGAARKILGPHVNMKLFSIISPGNSEDESKWQREVAKYNHAEWIPCNTANFKADLLKQVVEHADMPAVAWNNLAHYELCKTVRENGVTVLFNGQGADELFGGYTDYLQRDCWKNRALLYRYRNNWPMPLWDIFKGYVKWKSIGLLPNFILYKMFIAKQDGWIAADGMNFSSYGWQLATMDAKSKMKADYFGQKLGQMLLWEDVNGMAHHLESRNPFADNLQLSNYAFNTLFRDTINGGYTKYMLRTAAKDMVPNSILWRKDKQGFSVPDEKLTLQFAKAWAEMFMHPNLDDFIPRMKREEVLKTISTANKKTLKRYFKAVSLATYLDSM